MARVRLANWYKGSAPGTVVEVTDDELAGLRFDGRVAEVLPDSDQGGTLPPARTEAVNVSEQPEPVLTGEEMTSDKPKRRPRKSDE